MLSKQKIAKWFIACLLFSTQSQAENLWSDFSITALKGSNYQVGDNDRTVLTLEHASGNSWGDSFLFVDRLESDDGFTETYGELTLRYALFNSDDSLLSGVYLAGSTEIGDGFSNYLYGIGLDIAVPHFNYFQANFYLRNNEFARRSEQLTLVYGVPLGPLYFDGFIDIASATTDDFGNAQKRQINFTSQLKYDLAPHFELSNKLFVGIEYVYWNNKFGIDGVDERNVNLLLKWHF